MKIKIFILAAALTAALVSCDKKHHDEEGHEHEEAASAEDSMNWEAMDSFHLLMAECYHPFKDSSNLEPAKKYAGELAESAVSWSEQSLPASVNTEEVKAMVMALKESTAHFATTVAGGDDAVTAEELEKIHDDFHKIQEAWYTARHPEAESSEHH